MNSSRSPLPNPLQRASRLSTGENGILDDADLIFDEEFENDFDDDFDEDFEEEVAGEYEPDVDLRMEWDYDMEVDAKRVAPR